MGDFPERRLTLPLFLSFSPISADLTRYFLASRHFKARLVIAFTQKGKRKWNNPASSGNVRRTTKGPLEGMRNAGEGGGGCGGEP